MLWFYLKVHEPLAPMAAVNITDQQLARLLRQCGDYLRGRIATGTDHAALTRLGFHVSTFPTRSPTLEMFGTTQNEFLTWVRDYAHAYFAEVQSGQRPELAIAILQLPCYYEPDIDQILGPGAAVYLAQTAIAALPAELRSLALSDLDVRDALRRLHELRSFVQIRMGMLNHIREHPEENCPGYAVYSAARLAELSDQMNLLNTALQQRRPRR